MVHKLPKNSGVSIINSIEKTNFRFCFPVFQKLNFKDKFTEEKLIQRNYEALGTNLKYKKYNFFYSYIYFHEHLLMNQDNSKKTKHNCITNENILFNYLHDFHLSCETRSSAMTLKQQDPLV